MAARVALLSGEEQAVEGGRDVRVSDGDLSKLGYFNDPNPVIDAPGSWMSASAD